MTRDSLLITDVFDSREAGQQVEYAVLMPPPLSSTGPLPLILHLHGAMSSAGILESSKPTYDAAWMDGTLPPTIVACASVPTRNGFYIDQLGGPAWERLVAIELPELVATLLPLNGIRAALGFSMGGYGALKLAFRQPDRFRAVAASCPAIFPAERSMAVPEHNRPGILDELNRSMGETPERYAENCVPALLRSRRDAIRPSGLSIRLECGDRDEFRLHDGAMYLHDLMGELDVPHDWCLIPGIGHGDDADGRLASALVFLGNALR
ncbi:alpha/beta hydrolase [Novosphingobium pokkalii]|uniref:Alpha/beta hydrolase n=1 Tax=Novosphingobium pokkalii TaxID=1770194 RepID=A0ABV7UYH8_9SPHN|nr:alpha/beta hydrolase-fold protein [Novosphingobium pokkalii]GHD02948.1 hypothetical protein GCM10019060_38680 [Novosphingobium pokkalii]